MNCYLQETRILNYTHPAIKKLVEKRNWNSLPEYQKINKIYNFVKDEIKFGYNESDEIAVST